MQKIIEEKNSIHSIPIASITPESNLKYWLIYRDKVKQLFAIWPDNQLLKELLREITIRISKLETS